MKNVLLILSLVIFYNCKSQIVPVETSIDYFDENAPSPSGLYFKDLNDKFHPFLGEWQGTASNKNYHIYITETTKTFLSMTEDLLLIKYTITDPFGNILADTSSLPDSSQLVIKGDYFLADRETYQLNYGGFESECGQNGWILITKDPNPDKLHLILAVRGARYGDCPNGFADQLFPTSWVTVDRQ